MRLIDLDRALIEAEDECRMSDDWKVSHEMMNVFKYQPTVKAIPIELYEQVRGERDVAVEQLKSLNIELFEKPYLKAITIEWLNKRAEEIAFAYWTNARNKITLPLNELPLLIDQIIREWEKENEGII